MTMLLFNAGAERRSQRAQSTRNNNRAQNKVQQQRKTLVMPLNHIYVLMRINMPIKIIFHPPIQQQSNNSKQGCPGGGSAAECTLEACGSLRSLSARAFEACRKECQDRCKAGASGQNQRPKSNNQNRNKPQQRKQGSGRSQSQVNRIPLFRIISHQIID